MSDYEDGYKAVMLAKIATLEAQLAEARQAPAQIVAWLREGFEKPKGVVEVAASAAKDWVADAIEREEYKGDEG